MRQRRSRPLSLAVAAYVGLLASCFTGEGSLGGICESSDQCGDGQECTNGVCGNCGNGKIEVGELCFGTSSDRAVSGSIEGLTAFDGDGDGLNDVFAIINANCQGLTPAQARPCFSIGVLFPTGDGEFAFSLLNGDDEALPFQVRNFDLADFDGDEFVDVVLEADSEDFQQLFVIFDVNSQLFEDEPLIHDVGFRPETTFSADLDGDGFDDLVSASSVSDVIRVVLGAGNGTFTNDPPISVGPRPRLGRPTDADQDGDLDIVVLVTEQGDERFHLLTNDGSGNFSIGEAQGLTAGNGAEFVRLGDLDLDGDEDLVVFETGGSSGQPQASVFLNDGGVFNLLQEIPGGALPIDAVIDDLNADTLPDILVAGEGSDKLGAFLNRGGFFTDFVFVDVGSNPTTLLREDLDFDGITDTVTGSQNGTISVLFTEN